MNHTIRNEVIAIVAILGIALMAYACSGCASNAHTIDSITTVERAGCAIVTAATSDGTVKTACAVADELAAIAKEIEAARAAAPTTARKAGQCRMIPSTATCATDAELEPAIDRMLARRKDGGS